MLYKIVVYRSNPGQISLGFIVSSVKDQIPLPLQTHPHVHVNCKILPFYVSSRGKTVIKHQTNNKKVMASRVMLLGQVLNREALKPSIINVRIVHQVFDKHFNMFFPHDKDFKAVENGHNVTAGDIVRITQMPEKLTLEVEHEISEVVYPIGRVVDPVTGRRCRGTKYIDATSREMEAKRVAESKKRENYPL